MLFRLFKKHFELVCWIAAILLLFFMPFGSNTSLCIAKRIGFSYCPGCGIGRSIHEVLHFNLKQSFSYHFFGIPATIIIFIRIIQLIIKTKLYDLSVLNTNSRN